MKDRRAGQRRLALLVFGALLVLLFAGFAVAQGIGDPDVPSDAVAIVEDAPGDQGTVTDCHGDEVDNDPGTITDAEFDCGLQQTAARTGLDKVPKPGEPRYDDLKEAAMGDLLDMIWIQGEAEERGVEVTQRQVDAELERIVTQNFGCKTGQDPFACKGLQQFLGTSHFSEDDVLERVKLQLLSTELQKQVTDDVPPVTGGDIEEFYEAAEEQLTVPASRDVRLVLNRDKAKVEEAKARLEEDDSPESWNEVARDLSTDVSSKDNGGLRPALSEGLIEEPLNSAIFESAKDEIVGPIKTPLGWYVFEVVKIKPERVQPLNAVRSQIKSQLTQTAQQDAFRAFIDDYGSKWQSRTFCASGDVIDRCANFSGSTRPPNAPPACYEADPKDGRPEACPAPVIQLTPALPGTVSLLVPRGVALPQRPRPVGLKPTQEATLPGASGVPIAPTTP